jgi:pimeloyl-ACP methyl ester carboxylesterase
MAEPWHFEKLRLKSGISLQIARAGQNPEKPLLVMLHGFPECWYSRRDQLRALAPHFECVAPDLRGYGDSDAPVGIDYSLDKLVGDVGDLIEGYGRERGHHGARLGRRDCLGYRDAATAAGRAPDRDELPASEDVSRPPERQSAPDA